jgi:murein DD-endopeptidase MepM/ murein hydrolase activator NlpD
MPKSGSFGSTTLGGAIALLVVVVAACGAVGAFATIAPSGEAARPQLESLVESLPLNAEEQPAPKTFVREEQFKRGDTLAVFLDRLGIADAARLARVRALRDLRPGTHASAEVNADGELISLSFLSGRDVLVKIVPQGESFAASETPAPFEMQLAMKSGVIRSSLFAASDDAGVPDSVAMQLADVFAGDVDFHRDLRKGDRFNVVYEMYRLNGRAVRAGRVVAAEFVSQGKSFKAVRFGTSYYTPEGKNLRKAFLRSPLEFSRVSSGFGMRRHPIAKAWMKHKGIDYAAATGTRVRTVGDGIVDFVGVKGGYGKVVVVRHHGQYQTLYAHLSRFPAGLHRGQRVAQGDTIGFVGQTGWATGPHLHYEFFVGGTQRNPFSIAMPAAHPVPADKLAAFHAAAEPLLARLDLVANGDVARLDQQ